MEPSIKKRVLRLFTYGLYVVSAEYDGSNGIFLGNWLSQCSFDPPMIMLSVQKVSQTLAIIRSSRSFTIQVLASGQRELAGMLGRSTQAPADKLKKVRWHASPLSRAPILDDILGYLECRLTGELPAGDSVVLVGEVIEAVSSGEHELAPLTMKETGFKHYG